MSGLDARPDNSSCLAGDAPANTTSVDTEAAFPLLPQIQGPTLLLQSPNNNLRWYVLEQRGRILRFDNSSGANSLNEVVDLQNLVNDESSANESGLLSMAFHPDFDSNGYVYLFYQTDASGGGCCNSRLSRFSSTDAGLTINQASETVLIEFRQPYENHYGGHLGFDDEGYLYLTIGDGGSGGDPQNRAQNTSNIWGSMIRIDVDAGSPYGIPPNNPFADEDDLLCNTEANMTTKAASDANCPEIYAWGLRNTWRWSFDAATGDIWAGDVGQNIWEEVDIIQLGGNYGWRIREGAHCYNPSSGCSTAGLIDPVAEVQHNTFRSITGGYVYRGSSIPGLIGRYVFGDFSTGRIYSLISDGDGGWEIDVLDDSSGFNISTFAQDQNRELYVVNYSGAAGQQLHRFIDNNAGGGVTVPETLSETGCVDPSNPSQPAEVMIPYDINAVFWSDGAEKQRWLALPNSQSISVGTNQDWDFPIGSVLMKSFRLNDELIETRLLKRHTDGNWAGYTYKWNGAGTDADLVIGGEVVSIDGQDWIYPSGGQCLECHTAAAGRALGLETAQLNKDFTYPATGRSANQVGTLLDIGALSGTTTNVALADPYDTSANLQERARAWLHTNCAQCHRPGGTGNINMDLRYTTAFADMNICNVDPQNGNLGIAGAKRLAPGNAAISMIVERMSRRGDAQQMPPIGSNLTDDDGIALISSWINNLVGCD